MKKILFFAAALAVVSLASCGNGEKAETTVDSDTIVAAQVEVATGVDSLGDSVAAVAAEVVEAVVPAAEEGK